MYDDLAPYYDLVYQDWEAAMTRQGERLSPLLPGGARILDVAAGIGTQSLPLAVAGHDVVARDLSEGAIDRLRYEAAQRGLILDAEVADMRTVGETVDGRFDAVVALDNALPHLLSDGEIVAALSGFRKLLGPEGKLLVSVRDYEGVDRSPRSTHPYGIRTRQGRRYRLTQVWRWTDAERYETTMIVEEEIEARWLEIVRASSRYYAIPLPRLLGLFADAGVAAQVDTSVGFHQPLIVGRRG
jgi:hypothetical protein